MAFFITGLHVGLFGRPKQATRHLYPIDLDFHTQLRLVVGLRAYIAPGTHRDRRMPRLIQPKPGLGAARANHASTFVPFSAITAPGGSRSPNEIEGSRVKSN
jgi:hypothetical protein